MAFKHCRLLTLMLSIALLISGGNLLAEPPDMTSPLVIAHRGASGVLPEHTLEAYKSAIAQGADFIEPDLVMSADGVLICRHDIYLSSTTDVAYHPEFADRKRSVDGREDWFVEDFTVDELATLGALQPFPGRNQVYNNLFLIPTFAEVVALVIEEEKKTGRRIGIYPELKRPEHFGRQKMIDRMLEDLSTLGDKPGTDIIIQSFDADSLRQLRKLTTYPLVMLLVPADGKAAGIPNIPLAEVAEFADGIGTAKSLLLDSAGKDTGLVTQAGEFGLFVHAWTFRDDQVPAAFADGKAELERYLQLGIDGFFTDFPSSGVSARNSFLATQ